MKYKRALLLIALLISGLGCYLFQQSIVKHYGYTMQEESMTYLPVQESIKPLLLGYETAFANYLWIRTVIYFGHHSMSDKNFVWLEKMLDIISKLNPHFYPVYEFAGLLLPEVTGNVDAARIILDRGIYTMGKRRYNLAFYMGMIYFRYYNDRVRAAHYFSLAAHSDNAPVEKLVRLASAFLSKSADERQTIDMMAFIYQTSENPEVKRYLAESMKKMYADTGVSSTRATE